MAVYLLDDELWFPDPHDGEPGGLVAVGGDLSTERLLLAYSHGFFPWFSFHDFSEPHWYCPMKRFVIFPDEIHISHSLRQLLRQNKYMVTINHDFEGVIRGCSETDGRDREYGAWLGPDMIRAYTEMHRLGYASSIEVWKQDNNEKCLVGGLYGITLRNAFFGESMFSKVPNASKLALVFLADRLSDAGGHFIDCQFKTPFLESMGGRHISYDEYMKILSSDNSN